MARNPPKRSRASRANRKVEEAVSAGGYRLWAPWRYEYIRGTNGKHEACIFCFGTIDAAERRRRLILRADRDALVMLNRYPYNNGHLMVAPRRHIASPELLTRAERAVIAELISECCAKLREALHPSGLNVGANLGRSAGAGIADHMHWHIVPRWDGDTNFMPVLGATRVLSQALESSYEILAPLFLVTDPR